MTQPFGNWPICHSIPAMLSLSWENASPHVKQFAQKLHNLQKYNLLQVAQSILSGNDHEVQTVCTDNEYNILRAYAFATSLKRGMFIDVTWKSEIEGEPDSTYNCEIVGECAEGKTVTVLCEGENYDVCLYQDEVDVNKATLLAQFNHDFRPETVATVYMIDTTSKAFYSAYFTNEGKVHGKCKVEDYDGQIWECEYDNGNLVVK